jgi:hypothetical protein
MCGGEAKKLHFEIYFRSRFFKLTEAQNAAFSLTYFYFSSEPSLQQKIACWRKQLALSCNKKWK